MNGYGSEVGEGTLCHPWITVQTEASPGQGTLDQKNSWFNQCPAGKGLTCCENLISPIRECQRLGFKNHFSCTFRKSYMYQIAACWKGFGISTLFSHHIASGLEIAGTTLNFARLIACICKARILPTIQRENKFSRLIIEVANHFRIIVH